MIMRLFVPLHFASCLELCAGPVFAQIGGTRRTAWPFSDGVCVKGLFVLNAR